jgi:16S rRNA (cytosine1407-C5)-methyltransferase
LKIQFLCNKEALENSQFSILNSQFIRLWPQTYDTEGFFVAVLTKTASTKTQQALDTKERRETLLRKDDRTRIEKFLNAQYGTIFLRENERLFYVENDYFLTTEECAYIDLPLNNYAMGIPFGRRTREDPIILDHDIVTLRGGEATKNVCSIDDAQLQKLLQGQDCSCDENLSGHVLIHYQGMYIGRGKARDGKLKNHIPRWMVQMHSS